MLTGLKLVDASDQSTVATLTAGKQIDIGTSHDGSFGFEATVASGAEIASVKLALTGPNPRSQTENRAPYSLYGDTKQPDGTFALKGGTLPAGAYTLTATAYSEKGGEGTVLDTRTASFTVLAAPALSVDDATVEEAANASLEFEVTLDRSAKATVTVDYATSDGTAVAGEDYTTATGTLRFAAGETSKTVSVAVLDDAVDEGAETMTLTLSGPSGATIADAKATGTITNSDPIPQAWLARFGRTVTGQVLDAVEARLDAPRSAGAEASLAGQALPSWRGGSAPAGDGAANDNTAAAARAEDESRAALAAMTAWLSQTGPDGGGTAGFGARGDDGAEPQSRALTPRDFITGTSFALTGGSADGGGFASLWGRGSIARFDGREGSL